MTKLKTKKLGPVLNRSDIAKNYFARGSADFEIDDFENLDYVPIHHCQFGSILYPCTGLFFKGFLRVSVIVLESYSDWHKPEKRLPNRRF